MDWTGVVLRFLAKGISEHLLLWLLAESTESHSSKLSLHLLKLWLLLLLLLLRLAKWICAIRGIIVGVLSVLLVAKSLLLLLLHREACCLLLLKLRHTMGHSLLILLNRLEKVNQIWSRAFGWLTC